MRGYYFPWGTKHIPYAVRCGPSSGSTCRRPGAGPGSGARRTRATGPTSTPAGPRKSTALVLDLGARVRPFLTPDDPDAFEAVVRRRAGLGPAPDDDGGRKGPLI